MRVSIVYDGSCPLCRRVAVASKLEDRGAKLELIDARERPVNDIQGWDLTGFDLNEGFAVVVGGWVYHGAEAAHMLSALTVPSGALFRLFRWSMRTDARSRRMYPVFRAGRKLLLKLLRVPPI